MNMTINILINLFLIMAMLFIDAWLDSKKIKAGKTILHNREALIIMAIGSILMAFNLRYSFWLFLVWINQFIAMRFLLFDRILNKMMGWDIYFVGTTSKIDVFMAKMKKWGFDKLARVGFVMLTSFFVVGELTEVFLNEKQENLFAWVIFASIAVMGIVVTIKNFGLKEKL